MYKRTITDLGVDKVLALISRYALSPEGEQAVRQSVFLTDESEIVHRQQCIEAIRFLIQSNAPLPQSFCDIREVFAFMTDHKGFALDGEQVFLLAQYLHSAFSLRQFLQCDEKGLVANLMDSFSDELRSFAAEVDFTLQNPGTVKESHPAVAAIIARISQKRSQRTAYSQSYIRQSEHARGSNPVLRDGRLLIPVKVESKNLVEGVIHSVSQAGSTVFIEPYSLVNYNNDVVIAMQDLEIEKARLIARLSALALNLEDEIRKISSQIAQCDWLYSFSRWSIAENCTKAILSKDGSMNLINARHPLIKVSCVPINLYVPSSIKAVVLSGPNAGGKTVTVKTAGLFAVLNQIAGYLPASDGTSLPVYDSVFTDIGDDQSIEAALSTFSGHMNQISFILRKMTPSSLVILDELGSGTDGLEGASIARAVVEHCTANAELTLVTSHHDQLKQYAYASPIVLNASMEFDKRTQKPTFRVVSGVPGQSHALETAESMRLPKSVTDAARSYVGDQNLSVSAMINDLEARRISMKEKEAEIDRIKQALEDRQASVSQLESRLLAKEVALKKAQDRENSSFVSSSRKKLEKLVADLKAGELTKEKTKSVKSFLDELDSEQKELESQTQDLDQQLQALSPSDPGFEIKPGIDVLCGSYKREGSVIRSAGDKKWIVAIGPMKFTFDESQLSIPKRDKRFARNTEIFISTPMPKMTLDVRGMILEDATEAVATQIERCLVHGVGSFSIIHGYGDGILSTGIHRFLRESRSVESFSFARPEDGGQGKTYVSLYLS